MTKIAANFAAEFATALASTDAPTNIAEDNVQENLTHFSQALRSVSNQNDQQNQRSRLPADASAWLEDVLSRLSGEGALSRAVVAAAESANWYQTVSYTHLTLPTSDLV